MKLSPETEARLAAITPPTPTLNFINCVVAISYHSDHEGYELFRQYLNTLHYPEQKKFADEWEAQKFTSSEDFLEWLGKQPYFLEIASKHKGE